MRLHLLIAAVVVAVVAVLSAVNPAHAASTGHPVHWHAGHRIAVNVHGEVVSSRLPHCRSEDGSGQRSACTWNVGPGTDGNGAGRAYWVDGRDRVHYVWPSRRVPAGWQHVARADARILATGGHTPAYWQTCRVRFGARSQTVACPNGYTYTDAS